MNPPLDIEIKMYHHFHIVSSNLGIISNHVYQDVVQHVVSIREGVYHVIHDCINIHFERIWMQGGRGYKRFTMINKKQRMSILKELTK